MLQLDEDFATSITIVPQGLRTWLCLKHAVFRRDAAGPRKRKTLKPDEVHSLPVTERITTGIAILRQLT